MESFVSDQPARTDPRQQFMKMSECLFSRVASHIMSKVSKMSTFFHDNNNVALSKADDDGEGVMLCLNVFFEIIQHINARFKSSYVMKISFFTPTPPPPPPFVKKTLEIGEKSFHFNSYFRSHLTFHVQNRL